MLYIESQLGYRGCISHLLMRLAHASTIVCCAHAVAKMRCYLCLLNHSGTRNVIYSG